MRRFLTWCRHFASHISIIMRYYPSLISRDTRCFGENQFPRHYRWPNLGYIFRKRKFDLMRCSLSAEQRINYQSLSIQIIYIGNQLQIKNLSLFACTYESFCYMKKEAMSMWDITDWIVIVMYVCILSIASNLSDSEAVSTIPATCVNAINKKAKFVILIKMFYAILNL